MRAARSLLFLVCAVACAGCGIGLRAGPDFERPVNRLATADSFEQAGADCIMPRADVRWWTVFGDAELDSIVEDALRRNLDIKRATYVMLELEAINAQARAGRLPSVTLHGDYQTQELPEGAFGSGASSGGERTESFNASIAASHELDLWGRISRTHEAARADLLRSAENRRTIMQSVVAETVTLYLQMESLERRIMILGRSIEALEKSVRSVKGRYRRGLTSVLALKQAQRALANAESRMPQLMQDLGTIQQRLSLLLGRYPETRPPRKQPDDYFRLLEPVPPGLPSDLLENRPDVRAAEARLMALNARYGAAKANLFPRITLTGSYGYTSTELENLFTPDNMLWNFVAGLAQPVFNAGRLLAEKDAAQARYQQGVTDYAQTILAAFAEVEGALMTRREQIRKREYIIEYLDKARAAQQIAERRYERGLVDYLNVLDAVQERFNAEESLALVDLAIMTNRVTLHRALGGNWIESKDKDESSAAAPERPAKKNDGREAKQ
jgi:multidrug efflux system outer membrane protein